MHQRVAQTVNRLDGQGKPNLYDWADGPWVVLFSHPAAHTPVCTTELASFASLSQDWTFAGLEE